MPDDINFLGSAKPPEKDDKKGSSGLPAADDLGMHVPKAEPSATPRPPAPKAQAPQAEPKAPGAKLAPLFSSKIPMPAPKPSVPKPPVSASPPIKIAPKPSQPPKFTAPVSAPKGGDTLRVSLLTTAGGGSLSALTVRDRLRAFFLILLIGVVVDGLAVGGLLLYEARLDARNAAAEENVRDLDRRITEAEASVRPARNLQTVMQAAESALEQHVHWSNFLEVVEDIAHPKVQFGGISSGVNGAFSTQLFAADYASLAQQIVSLREDPRVLSATIGGVTSGASGGTVSSGVSTSIEVRLDPGLFGYKAAGVPEPSL